MLQILLIWNMKDHTLNNRILYASSGHFHTFSPSVTKRRELHGGRRQPTMDFVLSLTNLSKQNILGSGLWTSVRSRRPWRASQVKASQTLKVETFQCARLKNNNSNTNSSYSCRRCISLTFAPRFLLVRRCCRNPQWPPAQQTPQDKLT